MAQGAGRKVQGRKEHSKFIMPCALYLEPCAFPCAVLCKDRFTKGLLSITELIRGQCELKEKSYV
jgi:hypothetical protein